MIARMKWFLLLLSVAVLIEAVHSKLLPGSGCRCECNRERVSYRRPIYGKRVSIKQKYTTKCGFLGWNRCTRYRTKWTSTITGYTTGYRLKECSPGDCRLCPPGWPREAVRPGIDYRRSIVRQFLKK
ncbi:uncharacterized protein LOC124258757 [Haliotis rubra]|uniref:uncharacterized protein LOC124258757 n=1 Tax=Haliotis rubra TaxID=36100 RepID=UPI001EE5AFB1|nr:uncharacterized protein LOC124258757 [Haliotis rubra]